ncbi:MAG: DNA polymerase III subunit chi [Alphaproteobacteria bacterium]|jgi:DNA polymerase III subunit chi|nr:DNA polymerase III subunit chi [Alphaproteobacteria bacterium]MBT5389563.1 DNA polymerase III subunit chi [Alphaproteobacteria bacterium]MBT5541162.1 DNA polymerase III subunit chi [Alphaproteobacteria bacterium]MBT5654028.1 DNA polymerase III subunit chi [Alphaproteobacteria bacterium]
MSQSKRTNVSFYHLTKAPLEKALPKLLEKVVASKQRAVLMTGSPERTENLNTILWTYHPSSFLPHGSKKDGFPELQPIWLTHEDQNPNGAKILVLVDGAQSDHLKDYERCLDVFDGTNEQAVKAARQRWKSYKDSGHSVTYWQQNDQGAWESKASDQK